MKYKSRSLLETEKIAKIFVEKLLKKSGKDKKALVVALRGNLGSGKTTFVKAAALVFGVRETVTSPTFVLEKIYTLPKNIGECTHLVHIDAYRLQNAKEIEILGWKKLLESPQNIIFIEWPERVLEEIPKTAENISFRFLDEKTREIEFS